VKSREWAKGECERRFVLRVNVIATWHERKAWRGLGARQQRIPFRNDRKKGKCRGKGNSGFPSGMTDRKATAYQKSNGITEKQRRTRKASA